MNEKETLTFRDNVFMTLKYILCTSGAGLIQVVSFTILNEWVHLNDYLNVSSFLGERAKDYGLAYFIALVLSVLFNFTVNRKFTFQSANNIPRAMAKVFGYYLVFTPASIWWSTALLNRGWNDYAVLIVTMLINFVTEFTFCRFVVFGASINTAKRKGDRT